MAFRFEELMVWQIALRLSNEIDLLVKGFPREELYSLCSQMKRAADSISLNIAEGSTGQSNLEQARFLGYAQRSAIEVVNCLYLAIRRNYIQQQQFDKFYSELEKIVVKI